LLLAESENGLVQVTIFRRKLIILILREMPHTPFEVGREFFVAAFKQDLNVAGRFLTDLNQGVTRWMYFTGFLSTAFHKSPNNPWHALALVSPAGELTAFNRYFFLKGLLATFPQGSTFHACDSSLDGSMDWTYGQKPRLSAACATGPDGRLRVAIVNTTGIVSSAISKYYPAQPVRIDLQLPWRDKVFDAVVIGPDGRTRSIGAFTPGGAEGGPILNPFEMTLLVERA